MISLLISFTCKVLLYLEGNIFEGSGDEDVDIFQGGHYSVYWSRERTGHVPPPFCWLVLKGNNPEALSVGSNRTHSLAWLLPHLFCVLSSSPRSLE